MLHSGRLRALPTYIRLEWKGMEVANALAYYKTATDTAVKGFVVQTDLIDQNLLFSLETKIGGSILQNFFRP